MNTFAKSFRHAFAGLLGLSMLAAPSTQAALTLATDPLFLTVSIPPNLLVTLDDSSSMQRAYTPDHCGAYDTTCNTLSNRYTKSSYYNPLYYNPSVTYTAPKNADGTSRTTSFTAAYINGFDTTGSYETGAIDNIGKDIKGSTVDLGTTYRPTAGLELTTSSKSHVFMDHYGETRNDPHTGNMVGSNTGSNAPYFQITDYNNVDGSASGNNPGTNLVSVTVNGTAATNVGTFSLPCDNSKDPGNNNEYKTNITGNTLTLCFRDNTSMYGTTVVVTHKVVVGSTTPIAAYYYTFNSGNANCDGTATDNDCYTKVDVGAAEQQNFANWYSFYRTRNLATISAASLAFADLDTTTRLGWQALNSCNGGGSDFVTSTCKGWDTSGTGVSNAIKPFSSNKTSFYNWLFRLPTDNATPLRTALKRAGEYYRTDGAGSPYDNNLLDATVNTEAACRKNFHMIMTDGIWNDSISDFGNADNTSITLPAPDSKSYSPIRPFMDDNSYSLADYAFHYWATDLRGLDNNLFPYIADASGTDNDRYWNPRNDPAKWQHMVNFTVGLGLTAFLTDSSLAANEKLTYDPVGGMYSTSGSYNDIVLGNKVWAPTAANDAGNVSDLWHAAINSRGQFFSADNPSTLTSAFQKVVGAIQEATPSSAALSANSTSIQTGTLVYQAKFDSKDWSGTLLALPVDANGNIGAAQWSASALIPTAASRNIFTYNPDIVNPSNRGKAFTACSNLGTAQQTALNTNMAGTVDNLCTNRLNWLRGDASNEMRNGGSFRNRYSNQTVNGATTLRAWQLGDIINSDPAFVKAEDYGYGSMPATIPGQSTYATFVSSKANRTAMIYVGANDGMLHAIQADVGQANSGRERFAYVPMGVYSKLSNLTDPSYTHRYYVDGAPTTGDVYFSGGGGWRTVLVGGLNGGGKTIYALDITDPDSFSAGNVLWEFTDTDLGFTYSQPQIGQVRTAANTYKWVAIFGNGYNSTADRAYLYVVDIEDGTLIKKIAAGTATSNGLSTPVLHDRDGDKVVDAVYAGDLQGNMWKFDLSTGDTTSWGVAFSGVPLFTARNGSDQVQPITSQPKVGGAPAGGYLVYFGTGRYLVSGDVSDTTIQSFYGIWDNGATAITTTDRSQLLEQEITQETTSGSFGVRLVSSNTIDWATQKGWYMDMIVDGGTAKGERVISAPLIKLDRVIFVTLIPNATDPCVPGGDSWLMELSLTSGAAPAGSVFDINGDDQFTDADLVSGAVVSGVKSSVGIGKTPVWLDKPGSEVSFKEMSGTSGSIMTIKNKGTTTGGPLGTILRKYWMQIQ